MQRWQLLQLCNGDHAGNSGTTIRLMTDEYKYYETNRIKQNILSTELIHYKDFKNLNYIEIEYETTPKIKIKKRINSDLFIYDNGIYITNEDLTVNSYENFINDSTLIWIEKVDVGIPEKSNLILNAYTINPLTVLFENPLEINFKYPKKENGIGIYYYQEKQNKWIYMDTFYNDEKYSATIQSNELFALIKELNPPLIKNLIPDINAKYRAEDINQIQFYVEDDLSGITFTINSPNPKIKKNLKIH